MIERECHLCKGRGVVPGLNEPCLWCAGHPGRSHLLTSEELFLRQDAMRANSDEQSEAIMLGAPEVFACEVAGEIRENRRIFKETGKYSTVEERVDSKARRDQFKRSGLAYRDSSCPIALSPCGRAIRVGKRRGKPGFRYGPYGKVERRRINHVRGCVRCARWIRKTLKCQRPAERARRFFGGKRRPILRFWWTRRPGREFVFDELRAMRSDPHPPPRKR